MDFPQPVLDASLLTVKSEDSTESNGFKQKTIKDNRCYNDGKMTFYSGRLYNTTEMAKSQSSFLTPVSNRTMNRRFKVGDTFMSLFPMYRVQRDHKRTTMKKAFVYPPINTDGMPLNKPEKVFN